MVDVNYRLLQKIYNEYINSLVAPDGLTTECLLNYGITKKNFCPNCLFDNNLKKSSNVYKIGGPSPFVNGMICPYCNGIGYYGEEKSDQIYLAVIWDYRKWISPPLNLSNPDGYIQTICNRSNTSKIKQCKDLTVILNRNLSNPIFELYEEPEPAGLGDNEFLLCMWKKIGNSAKIPSFPPPALKCYSDIEKLELICDFINKCVSHIIGKELDCSLDDKCISSFTKLELLCNEINKCSSNTTNFELICDNISKCYSGTNSLGLLCNEINKCTSDLSAIGNMCGVINSCIPDSILKIKPDNEPKHINEIGQLQIINNIVNKSNNIKLTLS